MLYLQYENTFKSKSEEYKQIIHLGLLVSMLVGFVGAYSFDAYTQGIPISFSTLTQIGLTFFGGLMAGLVFFVFYLKRYSFPVLETLNLLTPSFCVAHSVGRVGCFCAGCCFGALTDSVLGVKFPLVSIPSLHFQQEAQIYPTQLFESAFVLLVLIFIFLTKSKNKFFIYIISYSIFRFLIEFIRGDNRGELFNQNLLTPSQFISILMFTTAILAITVMNFLPPKTVDT